MAARKISVNGTTLHVEDTGEEDLPALICLHSLFLDGRMFDELVRAATGRYRVIRPDFRGQGQSDLSSVDEITMDLFADDMWELIEHLSLSDISVAAQPMGGDVAVRLVSRDQSRFRGLVMMGSSACSETSEQLDVFREWVNGVHRQAFAGSSLTETMDVMFGQTTQRDPAKEEMLALWRDRIGALTQSLLPAMVGVVERNSALHLLGQLNIPILVFSGEEDQPRPPAWSDQLVELLPNGRLERLRKIGHSNILEAPEIVIPGALKFFDSAAVATAAR